MLFHFYDQCRHFYLFGVMLFLLLSLLLLLLFDFTLFDSNDVCVFGVRQRSFDVLAHQFTSLSCLQSLSSSFGLSVLSRARAYVEICIPCLELNQRCVIFIPLDGSLSYLNLCWFDSETTWLSDKSRHFDKWSFIFISTETKKLHLNYILFEAAKCFKIYHQCVFNSGNNNTNQRKAHTQKLWNYILMGKIAYLPIIIEIAQNGR